MLVFTNVKLQKEDILPLDLSCKEFSCSSYFVWTFWCRGKRPANTTNGASNAAAKNGRGVGGLQNQLVNKALEGLSRGGRSGMSVNVTVYNLGSYIIYDSINIDYIRTLSILVVQIGLPCIDAEY